jgi:hypothetical protein
MSERGKGQHCHWCERVLEAVNSLSRLAATRDHVHPKSKGGKKTVWACWGCNMLKGDMLEPEWVAFMANNPEWWKLAPRRRPNRSTYRRPLSELRSAFYEQHGGVIPPKHRTGPS